MLFVVILLAIGLPGFAGQATDLAKLARETGLDEKECYRIRDLRFSRDEVKIYWSDGFVVFGKPVNGRRITAVFTSDVEGGDGEVLVLPPLVRERRSLATFINSPTLNEHVQSSVMVFSDDTAAEMLEMIRASEAKRSDEMGLLLAAKWNSIVASFVGSFEVRLVEDLLSPERKSLGFFFAAFTGRTLGNFDMIWDPRSDHQISIGQVAYREDRRYFDTWTNFVARDWRMGRRTKVGDDFKLESVRIDATLEADLTIKAITTLQIKPLRTEKTLALELSQKMHVTEAKVNGQPAEAFSPESLRANLLRSNDNQALIISYEGEFKAGETVAVEIHHEGKVIQHSGNNVYFVGSRGVWYPNRSAQFARYEVTFRHPVTLDLVASGDLISEKVEGDTRISVHRTGAPARLFGFNLGDYEHAKITRGDLTVEVFANRHVESALQPRPRPMEFPTAQQGPPFSRAPRRPPTDVVMVTPPTPNPVARLQTLAAEVAEYFSDLSARFGPPPLKKLSVTPIPGRFGQGFPGLLYISTLAYLNPIERPLTRGDMGTQLFFSEILHAHEIAHQWWGNGVTSNDYQDDWLMESLANYSALMLLEKKKGTRTLDSVLDEYKRDLLHKLSDGRTVESAGPVTMGHRLYSSQFPSSYAVVTYEKGTWVLHMLRRRMGDENFQKMLAQLYQKNLYQPVSTEQFRVAAQQFLPPGSVDPKLESFFDQWVYGVGLPNLKLTTSVSGKAPRLTLKGTITQSEVDNDFSIWVPVEIQVARAKPIVKWVQTSNEPVTFEVTVPSAPTKVTLNPANSALVR